MSENAISAQGTLLERQALGIGAFTEIGELRDMSGPARARNAIDTTAHNDEDNYNVVGIRRNGEFSVSIGYLPGSAVTHHDDLEDAYETASRDVYRITFPNGRQWLFSGYVTNISPAMPVDDGLAADVTITPTGHLTMS